ncbi:integrase family protein [Pseudoalteromonas shioyasakiensis]|uniref:tyrosine-type recombinase/integrase n=1 Tax=Pseudoalteromonas shioyasakiensis TaxID=1190813 RepID=UPI00211927BC|nr:integrase family protein [Pseudoalteromonas shioyasakiensis]MCQ8877600.1 integrase family protein [Pseudoalteromonas shioyasakiensis]
MKITAAKLKSLNGKPYNGKPEISDGDNLSLRISPKGKITFQIRYRLNGKPARYKIGTYPAMTLAKAREECERQMIQIRKNLDPRKMKAVNNVNLLGNDNPTLMDAINFWYTQYCLLKRERPDEILKRITSCITDEWKEQYISEISQHHFSALFKSMNDESINSGNGVGFSFNSIIELRSALRFCLRLGYIANSDFEALRPSDFASDYEEREHFLSIKECRLIWSRIDHLALTDRNKTILRCAMVFGCRIRELYTAHKTDFDLDNALFTVRRENTKGKTHSIVRPIPSILINDLYHLMKQSPGFVHMFHNRGGDKPASGSSVSLIAKACYENIEDVRPFRMHDLRRTLSTNLTDAGCPLQFTEKLLGHKMKGVLAIYNKSPMLDELTEWLDKWVNMLNGE